MAKSATPTIDTAEGNAPVSPADVSGNGTSDTAASNTNEPLFVEVDELPVQARRGRDRKYDALVDAAFSRPGRWFRINTTFKSAGQAAAMRKQYADEVDTDGNVLHIKSAKVDGAVLIYVKADQPVAATGDATGDADGDGASA